MSAIVMNGDVVADDVKRDLSVRIERLVDRGITPGLGTILVGDDGPSAKYVSMKHDDAAQLGLHTRELALPATASQDDVAVAIEVMNNDPRIDAYIVQYPFPAGARLRPGDPARWTRPRTPTACTRVNLGLLVMGSDAPIACTPAGILRLLEYYEVPIAGRHVVIVGRGLTIGRPLANLLTLKRPEANAAVTVVHTGVRRHRRLHPRGRHPHRRRRLCRADHGRHGATRRRRRRRRASASRTASCCPTWPTRCRRWRDGSRRGSEESDR